MSNTPHSQPSLGDIDYSDRAIAGLDDGEVLKEIHGEEELYECGQGDLLWIKGEEYVVVDQLFGFGHCPLLIVKRDGAQGRLVGGKLSRQTDKAGVIRARVLDELEGSPSLGDLEAEFRYVSLVDEGRLDLVHEWTPDSATRECPSCDVEQSGQPIRIERQASKAVEIRKCTNTDCHHAYRFVRPFPTGESATILRREPEGEPVEEVVSGVFRCEEQDDFKFPLETHSGRDDGFWTAAEIAEFVNPKMEGDDPFGNVTITNGHGETTIRWRDGKHFEKKMSNTFREIAERPKYYQYLHFSPSEAWGTVL